eukprot:TRINITY_DN615_c0_g1_i2.p1 TRINITY_DN615_c0_g1~~TRINITY_DN615_c0_g1_i2.p1  ORF type:complete len:351 (+),score=72.21 TRINITY_DN615_c0_g1_i2:225-1277(+)
MDSTLILTKSGKVFPQSRSDWVPFAKSEASKLQELVSKGFKIVIFSNQKGISGGKQRAEDITGKINDLIATFGVPMQALLATSDDEYRKPWLGMWTYFVKHLNGGQQPDLKESFYCGDAAGRLEGWQRPGTKKDFSCTDRKFASNIGITFCTPEALFNGDAETTQWHWDGVDPRAITTPAVLYEPSDTALTSSAQELVVLVGLPASGKSTFAKKHLVAKGYVHVNQDTLKTKEKCVKAASDAISAGKSVVIDNTNVTPALRQLYVAIAQQHGIPARCYVMQTSLELAQHMNMYRERRGEKDHVPGMVYNKMKKEYVVPTADEGFAEVKKIYFKPEFACDADEVMFKQFHE